MGLSKQSVRSVQRKQGISTLDFYDRFAASYVTQRDVFNSNSFDSAVGERVRDQQKQLEEITKTKALPHGRVRNRYERLDEQFKEHGLQSIADIETEVRTEQLDTLGKNKNIQARVEGFNWGEFWGSAGGSMVDPVNASVMVASAPLAVKGLGLFLLSEAAIGGATETVIQYGLRDDLRELGFTEDEIDDYNAQSVAGATVGAAAFAGMVRGAGKSVDFGKGLYTKRLANKFTADIIGGNSKAITTLDKLALRNDLTPAQKQAVDLLREVAEMAQDAPYSVKNQASTVTHAYNLDRVATALDKNAKLELVDMPRFEFDKPTTKAIAKAGLTQDELEGLGLDLTKAEIAELKSRLDNLEAAKNNNAALRAKKGLPKYNVAEHVDDGTKSKAQLKKEAATQQALEVQAIAKTINDASTKASKAHPTGKHSTATKFDEYGNFYKRAIRIAFGENISKKYDKLPAKTKRELLQEADALYLAILEKRSADRLPTDKQVRAKFIEEVSEARSKGIELGLDKLTDDVNIKETEAAIKEGVQKSYALLNKFREMHEGKYAPKVDQPTIGESIMEYAAIVQGERQVLERVGQRLSVLESLYEQTGDVKIKQAIDKIKNEYNLEPVAESINIKGKDVDVTDPKVEKTLRNIAEENGSQHFVETDADGNPQAKTVAEVLDELDEEDNAIEQITKCGIK
ncbi:hypothetical protein V5T82_14220 [Magnetovibrio sp. PR-2]|uniref:hypothetical protein n=1 Tax=Magnetovibrio sp. PR-2 TaxID=3120356 RepID=UPI002FCE6392